MEINGKTFSSLGMGCWPIGGQMTREGQSVGYSRSDDAESLRAIAAALDHGVTVFDAAQAYGTGHAERLLGQALQGKEAVVVSKCAIGIDEDRRMLLGLEERPDAIRKGIDDSLRRLRREQIDVMLVHPNEFSVSQAAPIMDVLSEAYAAGKIGGFGWSTDDADKARAFADRDGHLCIEHAMNLFEDAKDVQRAAEETNQIALIRSPLGMGTLTATYDADTTVPAEDIRATNEAWRPYFHDGKVKPEHLAVRNAVRELLQSDGRSLVQGALCWIWGKRGANIPVPGARTVAQMVENAQAMEFGPLAPSVMAEIEALVPRTQLAPRKTAS